MSNRTIITKKVIDSNILRNPLLREYLSRSITNYAVLPDYTSIEAHKGDTLLTISESMAQLSEYPQQVIILKTTGVVCGLSGQGKGLQSRFTDHPQTKEFPLYCARLAAAMKGNVPYQRQLLQLGVDAKAQLERIQRDAPSLPVAFAAIAKEFTDDERTILRLGMPYTNAMLKRLMESVLRLAVIMFENHPNAKYWPDRTVIPNLFIFRMALCTYLLALYRISKGGGTVNVEKLQNDVVDVNLATFSTYFDGVLSKDEKVIKIHAEARTLLALLFGRDIRL